MKITFCHDNNANIHSKKKEVFDLQKDFNMTDAEWLAMSEDDRNKMVEEWAMQDFNFWYEEDEV